MKKMIILVGLLSAFTIKAEDYARTPATELIPLENTYAMFEVKTPKFEKVILDCQSFINGMSFYNDQKKVYDIRMVDYETCKNVYDFISQSKSDKLDVCIEIDGEENSVNLSNESSADCQ